MSSEILLVSSEMMHMRLDKLLSAEFPSYSRTYFQYLIENGFVLVNGNVLKKKDKPSVGDEIEICFQLTPEISLEPENIPLDILYEDDDIIAINKPVGMVTHPAPGHYSQTFVNGLLYHCKTLPQDHLRPGIVHRLDKETSGILLAAKTEKAHQKLVEMFSKRELKKTYLAICIGSPGDITIDAPIRRHPTKRKEMAVDPEGKSAITICKTLASNGNLSLMEVNLVTGRTHQIRVHMKYKGTPILGDTTYGSLTWNKKFAISHQLLHAYKLEFTHPITGKHLHLAAPIPECFKNLFTSI